LDVISEAETIMRAAFANLLATASALAASGFTAESAVAATVSAVVDFSNIQVSVEQTFAGTPTFQWLSSDPFSYSSKNRASVYGQTFVGPASCCSAFNDSNASVTSGVSASGSIAGATSTASGSPTGTVAISAFADGSQAFNYAYTGGIGFAYRAFTLSGPGIVYFTIPYAYTAEAIPGEEVSGDISVYTQVYGGGGIGSSAGSSFFDLGPEPSQSGSSSFLTLTYIVTGTAPFNTGYLQATVTAYAFSSVAAVPEPHEWAMMLAGLGLVGWTVRRRARSDGRDLV
jgi:hypothetical protein